ncbi:bifunctional proline dehydrogenase/L-glutamate gamma-semialdehyde dehydrogenase PutA [Novosphingobium sp.]|uniref:bifunctional proline dehydrogenase/L-glutamate gamma-semialdehyde dehydrogenase PutA n=1 Tax=Novosphingobium sp. TaxID=1874826 RepID=UPI003B5299C6
MSPFCQFAPPLRPATPLRAAITAVTRRPEAQCMAALIPEATLDDAAATEARDIATRLVTALRAAPAAGGVEQLVQEYALSTNEGVALMCLAEALLRIPDAGTRDDLIRDKVAGGDWWAHLGAARPVFVNAATWGLVMTGKLVGSIDERGLGAALTRLIARAGEPIIRRAVDLAMRLMGEQFVTGRTIDEALGRARMQEAKGFCYSYDMLGEAALTMADADRYMHDYRTAIAAIGAASAGRGIEAGPGISIKLSALHPRYARAQLARVHDELLPRVKALCVLARAQNIGLNIDAEEADRLELSLDLLEVLANDPDLAGWDGLGFVVQAYGKRCPAVIDWIIDLARRARRRIMVRLVKGAYWDAEIKRAQEAGLTDYPVYTQKAHTDVAYLACAHRLLDARDAVFPQFATHNAQTLAAIIARAGPDFTTGDYEFQCLHGMGEPLYAHVIASRPCRIYAPVGGHETLLAYLVRRLLENGANSSFVNRIANPAIPIEDIVADPVAQVARDGGHPHPLIALPAAILGTRSNSAGIDLADEATLLALGKAFEREGSAHHGEPGAARVIRNPARLDDRVGAVTDATPDEARAAVAIAAASHWGQIPVGTRAAILRRAADAFEADTAPMLALIVREAGKSVANAVAELREAVDFLRYYADEAERIGCAEPLGPVVCISPWNFPLAIFTGQIAAALVAGNPVLAKPAEETPLIAAHAVRLLHAAGIPADALQLVQGDGTIGAALVGAPEVAGVMFTGSTAVGRLIQRQLATRLSAHGRPIPLIAETGGQNAMVVDSSALPEQVVADCIASAFDSAGQRCSALRVACLQDDIAEPVLAMLKGAMAELRLGPTDVLAHDIGPVITAEARVGIENHIAAMAARGARVHRIALPPSAANGYFVAPALIELAALSDLGDEVFGPVLHVVRYARADRASLIDAINALGYGLTFGLHTRLDTTIAEVTGAIRAGNIYVNRNTIGAVVGVQPFGGHGLSGTGPKAGGPLYLARLNAPRCDAALSGGASDPAAAQWLALCGVAGHIDMPLGFEIELPGPVGERNSYRLGPCGTVLALAETREALVEQVAWALAAGNYVVLGDGAPVADLIARLPEALRARIEVPRDWRNAGPYARALVAGSEAFLRTALAHIAGLPGPIVTAEAPCAGGYAGAMLLGETSISINTTAAGGNASLMALA